MPFEHINNRELEELTIDWQYWPASIRDEARGRGLARFLGYDFNDLAVSDDGSCAFGLVADGRLALSVGWPGTSGHEAAIEVTSRARDE